jgi:HlyD family secretion protein
MKIVRILVGLVLAVVVLGITAVALKPHAPPPLQITTAVAQKQTITRLVEGAGKLEPQLKVNVSSNITGDLTDLKVAIGDKVTKGQYLGQIDAARYYATLHQMEATLESAKANLASMQATLQRSTDERDRQVALSAKGLNSPSDVEVAGTAVSVAQANLDAAEGQVEATAAQLDAARTDVGHATLTSPIDGVVLAVDHRVGERVRGSDLAEDVVLVIGSMATLWVKIDVSEHDVVYLSDGQKAHISIDAFPDTPADGTVVSISRDAVIKNPDTDAEVTTFPVWIDLLAPPDGALSGMSAQVSIETETHDDALGLPIQCVTARPETQTDGGTPTGGAKLDKVVFVVDNGTVHQRKVETGLSSDSVVEITGGLDPGDVVVEGPYRAVARELNDGDHVTVDNSAMSKPPSANGNEESSL